ncbi:MAG: hypothetical protein AAFQ43_15815, partial [Bacteroidota bacterium]
NEVIHLGTTTEHRTLEDNLALATTSSGLVEMCQTPASTPTTITVSRAQVREHLARGARLVACDGTPAS